MTASIENIKLLIVKFETANSKIEYDYSERVSNPRQQAVATRFYNQAHKMGRDLGLSSQEFINLHRSVIGLSPLKY